MQGTKDATTLNEISRGLGFSLPTLTLEECQGILSNIAVELFAESNPENMTKDQHSKAKPLGLLAMNWLMEVLSIDQEPITRSDAS